MSKPELKFSINTSVILFICVSYLCRVNSAYYLILMLIKLYWWSHCFIGVLYIGCDLSTTSANSIQFISSRQTHPPLHPDISFCNGTLYNLFLYSSSHIQKGNQEDTKTWKFCFSLSHPNKNQSKFKWEKSWLFLSWKWHLRGTGEESGRKAFQTGSPG